jgi:uncharacterized protein
MKFSRRDVLQSAAAAWLAAHTARLPAAAHGNDTILSEVGYGDVTLASPMHQEQLRNTHEVLMNLSEDSLLRPFRQIAGQPAPGADLGGWYNYDPHFNWHEDDAGFAPGATFGQWVSALARYHAMTGDAAVRAKVLRLNQLYAATISERFYEDNRFPAYCYDKLVLGLIDSQHYCGDRTAFQVLDQTTRAAVPHLPQAAVDRELEWRPGKDQSYRWDESYTNPENLFLAYQRGAGEQYRELATRFLDDATWFDPLSRNENVLAGKHAYSYVNSLSSAMQAYLTLNSGKHLNAARNAFTLLTAQSYPTGGWGPDEKLITPGSGELHASLSSTHNTFETPCGSYAHFKLTRYLLRATRDARYGDSMERVMYNTVLGAKPMQPDGRAFYYADYNFTARKIYSNHRFPCCSGTLPQVATDYGMNSYLRDASGLYVNLYVPSTVRWTQGSTRCSLEQGGDYPFDNLVTLHLRLSQSSTFALYLRIPAWAQNARIEINGKRLEQALTPGTFAALTRQWRDNDRIEIELPRQLRLEAVDPLHAQTVALVNGPLVLFAMTDEGAKLRPRPQELLTARQTSARSWQAMIGSSKVDFLPYVTIGEAPYSAFLTLAS